MYPKFLSPSRRLICHLRDKIPPQSSFLQRYYCSSHFFPTDFIQEVENPINKTQIYISRSKDPFLNLSIEHYLFEKTPTDSTVLFIYTNQNCVVIGRNQNPWREAYLHRLKHPDIDPIALVRRRSGGGAVFHDLGNVNYCVICPSLQFDRDKHAEMVKRALHKLGVERAMVNQRHDIVLKPEPSKFRIPKVSGTAYKLTKERSLHHGTCLLNSPNISNIFQYLRSPAARFITSHAVDSINSSVANVKINNVIFEEAVVAEFGEMYGSRKPIILQKDMLKVPEIAAGVKELMSSDWIFGQTPEFTFSTDLSHLPKKKRLPLPKGLPPQFLASFTARHGVIINADIHYQNDKKMVQIGQDVLNQKLHEIKWNALPDDRNPEVVKWLYKLFCPKFQNFAPSGKKTALPAMTQVASAASN